MSLEANRLPLHLKFDKNADQYRFETVLGMLGEPDRGDRRSGSGNGGRRTERPSNSGGNKLNEQQMGVLGNAMDSIAIQKREESYLSNHEKLNEAEYNRLFSGKERLRQGQIGDCYLVAGINQLANAQHFDTLMRTSISRVQRKGGQYKGKKGYMVQIPFGEPSARKIYLQDDELRIAKINGNTGYKILELAYAKNRRPNNKQGNKYSPITEEEFKKIKGGWTHEVLQTFLGKQNIGFSDFGTQKGIYSKYKTLESLSQSNKKEIINFLKHYDFNVGNNFISLASRKGSSDQKKYEVGGKSLYYKHAYSIQNIKKNSKGDISAITVLNPHNNSSKGGSYQDFSVNEFFQAFAMFGQGKIQTKEFLNEKALV